MDQLIKEKSPSEKDGIVGIFNLNLSFGGIQALRDINLLIKHKGILALIGPNGAGKTSLLNCLNGFYHPQGGKIFFEGKQITHLRPDKICSLGISRTFQHIELYKGLTTLDNLMAARHSLMKSGIISGMIYFGKALREEIEHRMTVEEIIELLELESIRKKVVGSLPYGLRKRVDLARALVIKPKLLLLDEPTTGMNLEEKEDMVRYIIDAHELYEIPIVLVGHDMEIVMDIANRIVVLEFGQIIAEGSPDEIKTNPKVIAAYLGVSPKKKEETS